MSKVKPIAGTVVHADSPSYLGGLAGRFLDSSLGNIGRSCPFKKNGLKWNPCVYKQIKRKLLRSRGLLSLLFYAWMVKGFLGAQFTNKWYRWSYIKHFRMIDYWLNFSSTDKNKKFIKMFLNIKVTNSWV